MFEFGKDFFLRSETHFDIELIKLAGRTVRSRVLVSETRRDLEVSIETGRH